MNSNTTLVRLSLYDRENQPLRVFDSENSIDQYITNITVPKSIPILDFIEKMVTNSFGFKIDTAQKTYKIKKTDSDLFEISMTLN